MASLCSPLLASKKKSYAQAYLEEWTNEAWIKQPLTVTVGYEVSSRDWADSVPYLKEVGYVFK